MQEKGLKQSYIQYRDIYKTISKIVRIKADGRKKTKAIPYSLYFKVMVGFFKILMRDLVVRKQRVHLPGIMGYLEVRQKEHKRAFHIRLDKAESKLKGEPVRYKVPIIEDYYHTVSWTKRDKNLFKTKLVPSKYLRELVKENYKDARKY